MNRSDLLCSFFLFHFHFVFHHTHLSAHINVLSIFERLRCAVFHFYFTCCCHHSAVLHGHVLIHVHPLAVFYCHHFPIFHHHAVFHLTMHFVHLTGRVLGKDTEG